MGIDRDTFYDETRIAILPMGFCYPGKGKSGDLPPKPICAETWREKLITALPNIALTLVIGQYAQAWHLPYQHNTLTETVSVNGDGGVKKYSLRPLFPLDSGVTQSIYRNRGAINGADQFIRTTRAGVSDDIDENARVTGGRCKRGRRG